MAKPLTVYKLTSTDIRTVGGPMYLGDRTTTNFVRYFRKPKAAQASAVADYGKPITWTPYRNGDGFCSGDLLYVMYDITAIKVLDK